MGLNLSSFFHYNQENITAGKEQTVQMSSKGETSTYRVAQQISNMTPGQTLSGEIVAIRNGEVDIALDKDLLMTARMERSMNLVLGQTVSFEVGSVSGTQVSLRPLFENMGQNPTVLNAITEAHIPLNNTSTELVSAMMENGMPVDRESVQSLYRQIVNNPDVSGNTIVQMNRMQIPITAENVQQYENYKNYEHSVLNAAEEVADNLLQAFDEVLKTGGETEIKQFFQKMMQMFDGTQGNTAVSSENTGNANAEIEGKLPQTQNGAEPMQNVSAAQQGTEGQEIISLPGENQEALAGKVMPGQVATEQSVPEMSQKIIIVQEEGTTVDSQTDASKQVGQNAGVQDRAVLAHFMQKAGVPEELAQAIKSGALTDDEVLQEIQKLLKKSDLKGNSALNSLLSGKAFANLLRGQVTNQWMLQPQDVAVDGKVEDLYRKIQQQTAKLTESLSGIAKENSPLMKSISTLSNNVEFMNQLNQLYTYVQLPLKMSRENAHGDLYVYTNKKNLAKKDGNVSALLHLEMEHLGTMDIYVAMQQTKVSTKFCLQKEEYLDFMAENMHILDERLKKRGYSMTSEVRLKEPQEKENPAVDEIFGQENEEHTMISKLSFDVRA